MTKVGSFKDLIVYQKAYRAAMEIFEISKTFSREEQYSLTDQIRRSSRSVTSCIAEAWARRRYIKSFVSKLIESLGEEYETEVWLDYSKDCQYITEDTYDRLTSGYDEVRKMLISIINNPDQWCNK
jgi:four helix bundle protein